MHFIIVGYENTPDTDRNGAGAIIGGALAGFSEIQGTMYMSVGKKIVKGEVNPADIAKGDPSALYDVGKGVLGDVLNSQFMQLPEGAEDPTIETVKEIVEALP